MPELPEVQTVVRTLAPHLVGRTFARINHLRADIVAPEGIDLANLLTGRRVKAIARRGKKILIRLDTDATLCIHLGMTGRLTIERSEAQILPHTHLIAGLSGTSHIYSSQLRFRDPRRFGGVWWIGRDPDDTAIGPEPLSLRPAGLLRRLGKTTRPMKAALLDQRVVAGLGNIYVSEALFRAGLSPKRMACTVQGDRAEKLAAAVKAVLTDAIAAGGSSLRDYVQADGELGYFQKQWRVYEREGKACWRCNCDVAKTKGVKRITQSGRSTYFCPRKQK